MSQISDADSEYGDDNVNFWSPKNYMRTVKRLENEYKLSQDLTSLILERSDLEKHYATSLRKWSGKWMAFLETGYEYGTAKKGWQSLCTEAIEVADIHSLLRNQLIEEIQPDIKKWQKEHFHKPTIPGQPFKEVKALEMEFEYIQKPWNKKLKKSNVSKKEYHTSCKQEKSLTIQLQNAKNDSTQTADQKRKLPEARKIEEKLKKTEKDVERNKTVYQASLNDLEGESGRYMEEMEKTFKRAQAMEKERIEYFKETFEKIRMILNISKTDRLKDIYENCKLGITEINSEVDLKNWSMTNGSAMVFVLPQFEEYTPELTGISSKRKMGGPNTGVTLKNITSVEVDKLQPVPLRSNEVQNDMRPSSQTVLPTYDEAMNPFRTENENFPQNSHESAYVNATSTDSFYDTIPVDDSQTGVKVRALYNYKSQEEDELNLVAGEIFDRLEEEDEQGWCKGRVNGVIGLYPANYANPI